MELIRKYFPELSDLQMQRMEKLHDMYQVWNARINVISRKDMDMFYIHHVLHSLSIAKFIQFKQGTEILDLGTGGGFPGIPLAIYFEDCKFTLIDGRNKKIMVVNEIINELGLKNAKGMAIRAEELKMKFDFVTARAVTQMDRLLPWCRKLIKPKMINAIPNGLIALKGGNLHSELKSIQAYYELEDIHNYFPIPYFEEKRIVYIQI